MRTPTPISLDTSPEAEAAYLARLRKMTPGERILAAARITSGVNALALAGLRERHPQADERELFLRLAALRLDRRTMIDAYEWDPEIKGY